VCFLLGKGGPEPLAGIPNGSERKKEVLRAGKGFNKLDINAEATRGASRVGGIQNRNYFGVGGNEGGLSFSSTVLRIKDNIQILMPEKRAA